MNEFEQDRTFISAAVADLENYLLSKELYLPLTAPRGGQFPKGVERLSLGNVLLCRARLAARQQDDNANGLDELFHQMDAIQQRWVSAWRAKSLQEYPARLRMWGDYLQEALKDRTRFSSFAYQVRLRVILQLLETWIEPDLTEFRSLCRAVDARLLAVTEKGPFIWDSSLQRGFPETNFAFLYRKLPDPDSGGKK